MADDLSELRVTRITAANQKYFVPFLPADLRGRLGLPTALAIGAVDKERAVGILLAEIVGSSLFVRWVFVATGARRRGVGALLFHELERAAAGEIRDVRLAFTESEERAGLAALLTRPGYARAIAEGGCRFRLSALHAEPLSKIKAHPSVLFWRETPDALIRAYGHALRDKDDIPIDLPLRKEAYFPLSAAAVRGDRLLGVCLFKKIRDDLAVLSLLRAGGASPEDSRTLIASMLKLSLTAVRAHFPAEAIVETAALDKAQTNLFRKLASDVEEIKLLIFGKVLPD